MYINIYVLSELCTQPSNKANHFVIYFLSNLSKKQEHKLHNLQCTTIGPLLESRLLVTTFRKLMRDVTSSGTELSGHAVKWNCVTVFTSSCDCINNLYSSKTWYVILENENKTVNNYQFLDFCNISKSHGLFDLLKKNTGLLHQNSFSYFFIN